MITSPPVPLKKAVQDVSAQLESMCRLMVELEETVSREMGQDSGLTTELILKLQTLDRVNQGLHDMAVLTGLLAKSTGTETVTAQQVDVIYEAVKLSTTKALFRDEPCANGAADKTHSSSDLDLF